MQRLFDHILVPVGFNRNTNFLMEKAVETANHFGCDIHLLHVCTNYMPFSVFFDGYFSAPAIFNTEERARHKMKKLVSKYRHRLREGLLLDASVRPGSWDVQMKELIITKHINLVMIPRHKNKFFGALVYEVDVNELSLQSQCPILTVTRDFDVKHLQNIVVPVNDFLPLRKLSVATRLASQFNGMIHLMGHRSNRYTDDKRNVKYLTMAYQLLKDYADVKVYCSSKEGKNVADDTLAYATNIQADLIVVNSGKESVLKGWFSRWLGNYLYKRSAIPVLTIAPK
ncbi:MAG: universal stress protein [Chitinophagales bacterium]|nr:universal stress protein [Chitinophagales bacterium]